MTGSMLGIRHEFVSRMRSWPAAISARCRRVKSLPRPADSNLKTLCLACGMPRQSNKEYSHDSSSFNSNSAELRACHIDR